MANFRQMTLNLLELSKVRMIPMVLIVATYGFFLGGRGEVPISQLIVSLIGMSFVSAGSASLNNYLERDVDSLMIRTRERVLPTGIITPLAALIYGISTVLFGVFLLVLNVNLITGFLMLLASFLYVLVYTPMKRWSTWNTFVGAIPGALPAMAGWTAATGEIGYGAWILFFILFTWQHPHFYAIAIMHKADYIRGGFKMLPLVDEGYSKTNKQIIFYSILLLLVSLLPVSIGLTGQIYFWGAIVLGALMLAAGITLCVSKSDKDARRLFRASLVYLPALLMLIAIDFGV